MKKLFYIGLLSFFSLQSEANETSDIVFKMMNERLHYMEDVALYKATNDRSIEDKIRERTVVVKAMESACQHGLAPKHVGTFIKAQISVAKAIQYRYRADLLSQESTRIPRNLQKEVRPALIQLGNNIIQQIAKHIRIYGQFNSQQYVDFDKAINVDYVTQSDKRLLFNALISLNNN